MLTLARGLVMELFSSSSIPTNSHALTLFVIYLFIRCFRAIVGTSFVESDDAQTGFSKTNSNHAVTPLSPKLKLRSSISHKKMRRIDNSIQLLTSSSFKSEERQYDYDYTMSLLENNSSLELESTFNERRRFVMACNGDVTATKKRLNNYLRWNNEHIKARIENEIKIKPTRDRDSDMWVESCLTAMQMSGEVENIVLPRIIRMICWEDKCNGVSGNNKFSNDRKSNFLNREGYRTFCIRPALLDIKLAKASTYTMAVAIYLDRSCNREKLEKVTLCVDVRAGRGWPNTHVLRLIPFMKHSMKILLPLFPERLNKALVYPVPAAFFCIWKMISKYLDPLTVKRVCVLEGKCKIEAAPPIELLKLHFDEEELERLEASRIDSFRAQRKKEML